MEKPSQIPIRKTINPQNTNHSVNNIRKKSKVNLVILILIIVLVLGGLGFAGYRMMSIDPMKSINQNEYQALFLTNGQAYFGKINQINSNYVKITNIYYLQAGQAVQPKSTTASQSALSLVKLGKEIHGPENVMFVSRSQVLFWENLRNDGQVVQAISKSQN